MKYAAHFWLRPDGSIGKFPVLTFNNDGVLIEKRERDVFAEEAGMQLINGLFVPGVIDIMPFSFEKLSEEKIIKYIKNQYVNLTSILGVPYSILQNINVSNYPKMKFVDYSKKKTEGLDKDDFYSAFEKMRRGNIGLEGLEQYLGRNAKLMGLENVFGSFRLGTSSGLIAISNIDYSDIRITNLTKIKKIL